MSWKGRWYGSFSGRSTSRAERLGRRRGSQSGQKLLASSVRSCRVGSAFGHRSMTRILDRPPSLQMSQVQVLIVFLSPLRIFEQTARVTLDLHARRSEAKPRLKRVAWTALNEETKKSSAGNTRGLIEAVCIPLDGRREWSLPRGIPAASLKLGVTPLPRSRGNSLPRGIPAASLKLRVAGSPGERRTRLPRGIPAASLKLHVSPRCLPFTRQSSAGNTRGLIEAL